MARSRLRLLPSSLRLVAVLQVLLAASAAEPRRPSELPPCTSGDCQDVLRRLEQRTAVSPTSRPATLPEELSEERAVAIALRNNARLQAALRDLAVARADILDAGSWVNPTLQLLFPVGPKPFENLLTLPIETLWQRPRRVAAANLNFEQIREVLTQNGLDLTRDIKVSLADFRLSHQRVEIAEESTALRRRIAELTAKRLEAGDISVMESKLPEIEYRSFTEQLAAAQRDIEIVRQRLRTLMGLGADGTSFHLAASDLPRGVPSVWNELRDTAMSRPDLRAAEWSVEAALLRARWQRSRVINLLAPVLSVKGVGDSGIRSGPGLTSELPVFNRNQGPISRADAEVERAAAQYAALRDQMELELRQAHEQYMQADRSLQIIRTEILPQVNESVRLVERAHANGDASFLFVLETGRQVHDIRLREAEAEAALRRAHAQLERAAGREL